MMLPAVVSGLKGLGPLNVAAAVRHQFGQPEVHQFRAPWGQHDVSRLQIPVHNALAVRNRQRLGHSNAGFEDFVQRHRTFA